MLPYKYITSFEESIAIQHNDGDQLISSASLDSLKELAPENIDFEKNIDLVGVAFNAAVANRFNKNGDGIDTATALAIKDYFIHKPTNIEHQKQKVVGHIVGASLSAYGSNEVLATEDASSTEKPFNIALSAVVYKTVNPEFAELVEKSTDKESELYQTVSASWEIGFNDYVIAVGSDNLEEATIIPREQRDEYSKFLKAYGGNGRTDKGEEVHRLIVGDIYPIGIGFTSNPAADVKGVVLLTEDEPENEDDKETEASIEVLKIKNNFLQEKSSHLHKGNVIINKNHKLKHIMDKEILNQVTETLEAQASSKKLSEEAIANITKVFHDAIIDKSEKWQQEKEDLQKEKEELAKAQEASDQDLEDMKVKLSEVSEELATIKTEVAAQQESERFTERMTEIDSEFLLEDEDRVLLASELKDLDSSEEAYAQYKEKLNVVWKHKTKAFKEEQEKIFNEKIEEEVQKRLASLANETETEVETPEETEAAAEEVIESAETEEEAVANNNSESIEEEISLREKFKKSFSKDSVQIQY